MSIGRSKEEQELTSMLARTLVAKEVLEPMEKIGWGHGTPPPPAYGTTPAEGAPGTVATPASVQPAGQPVQTPAVTPASASPSNTDNLSPTDLTSLYESLRDSETGLIMKKYKTVEEAIKGSGHLANMAKQAFSENAMTLKELERLRAENLSLRTHPTASPAVESAAQPTVSPSRATLDQAQANLDKVLSEIAENGGILDADNAKALSKAQREVADAAADLRVNETLNSRAKAESTERDEWNKVDKYMSEHYPAAARFSDEVALYMQSDSLLSAAVNALLAQGDRIKATELAWKSFEKAHGDQVANVDREKAEATEADLAAREQVRKEQLDKARRDAGVVQGSAGGAGAHPGGNANIGTREEIEAAREQMRREGDAPGSPGAMRFRQLVIGHSLDPSIFGQPR